MGVHGGAARLAAQDHTGEVPADQEALWPRPEFQVGGRRNGAHTDPGAVRREGPVVVVAHRGRLLLRRHHQPLVDAGRSRDLAQPGLWTQQTYAQPDLGLHLQPAHRVAHEHFLQKVPSGTSPVRANRFEFIP